MRRRSFIAVVTLALAGCSQSSNSPDESEVETSTTPDAESTTAATSESASLSVAEFSVPSVVEIGTPFTMTVAVENDGGSTGVFESPVSVKRGTADWQSTPKSVRVEVAGGETATEEYEMEPVEYRNPASYRLDAVDEVARTIFTGRELAWEETHDLPNGVAVTVGTPSFSNAYTHRTSDGEATEEPPSKEKWAVFTARAENTGEEPAEAPLMADLIMHRDDDEFRGEPLDDNPDRYRGGELEPGAVVEGEIPCTIPADLGLGDLRVEYAASGERGDVEVTWSSTPNE